MTTGRCHLCGAAVPDPAPWIVQGHPTVLCYACWEAFVGTGDEPELDPDGPEYAPGYD